MEREGYGEEVANDFPEKKKEEPEIKENWNVDPKNPLKEPKPGVEKKTFEEKPER